MPPLFKEIGFFYFQAQMLLTRERVEKLEILKMYLSELYDRVNQSFEVGKVGSFGEVEAIIEQNHAENKDIQIIFRCQY